MSQPSERDKPEDGTAHPEPTPATEDAGSAHAYGPGAPAIEPAFPFPESAGPPGADSASPSPDAVFPAVGGRHSAGYPSRALDDTDDVDYRASRHVAHIAIGETDPLERDGLRYREPLGPQRPPREHYMLLLFGRRRLALGKTRHDRKWGWIAAAIVAIAAGVIRLVNLGHPGSLVFDETYYVKYAYTLGKVGYEAAWPKNANPAFEAGHVNTFLHQPDYVVHPPLGKWMISWGMDLFGGATNPWAWRISTAIVGIIAVFLLVRIARRLFASTAMGIIAGSLMAIDGEAIVASRTGLLDNFLMFWVLIAFGLLLLDRDQARRRLADKCAAIVEAGGEIGKYGPRLGWRWYRFAAAIALGLSCGVKWSGIYFLAVFALLSVIWDALARRKVGVKRWWEDALLVEAIPAFFTMIPTALVAYLATWMGWFTNPNSYMRQWAVQNPGQGITWLPATLRSFVQYHVDMWNFHTHLDASHPYAAKPLGWMVQWRPTSYYWQDYPNGKAGCSSSHCVEAITSIGNPILWWLATLALIVTVVLVIRYKDWRGIAALSGIVAGWLPWFAYWDRTIFTFYSIAFTPWVVLTLVYVFTFALERTEGDARRRRKVKWVIIVLLTLIGMASVFWYPLWVAMPVSYNFWHMHMWLPSWI